VSGAVRYLVTGASRGIGRALVELLAPSHEVIALGRSPSALSSLPVADRVLADLSDPSSLASVVPRFDRLDGVVHCAGIAVLGVASTVDSADWARQFAVNVFAPAELTRLLLPALRAAGGAVVFVNSGQGQRVAAGWTAYAASKFALRALADGLRQEEPSLRVSTVYPGRTATDMQRATRAFEGLPYVADDYLRPSTVAGVIAQVLATPPDGVVPEVTLRPRPG
jgi:NAD(P)-dependent dehydrogenase (short-subunit alcohol dehydrogenase family)